MKKLLVASLMLCFAFASFGQILNSAHDLRNEYGITTNQICIVCHTPHHGDGTVADAPLWNHEVTTATFILYSSPTMDATDVSQPDASSKLCLSCHDGTVAVANFGGYTGGSDYVTGGDLIGTDLSVHHPVTFTYDAALALADGGLFDPTTQNSGLGGFIDDDMLFAGKLQCASCHDVHNADNNGNLLIKPNGASALCLTCHNK